MLAARRASVPSLPSSDTIALRYAARLDALATRPRTRWPLFWTGFLSAVLGLVGGVALTLLVVGWSQVPAVLTPQQQLLYGLVQDLGQTSTPDEVWRLMTQINKIVGTLHLQPRPGREVVWPMQHPSSTGRGAFSGSSQK